ncbi:MAG: DUF4386 domain-containing protein [Thermoanaerobaculales bacterium]
MTRTTNARIAGVTFLVYIAATIASMVLFTRATSGDGIAAQLAAVAQHVTGVRLTVLLGLLENLCALVLAVTLYAITRVQDPDLAMLALTCRVAEGIAGMDVSKTLGLLWLATATDATALDSSAAHALGAYLLRMGETFNASAFFFAVGSTLFSWLLLRGRMIPVALAWLGVLASILTVVCFPLQLVGLLGGPVTSFMWFPVMLFEVALALWLIFKGVAAPGPTA